MRIRSCLIPVSATSAKEWFYVIPGIALSISTKDLCIFWLKWIWHLGIDKE